MCSARFDAILAWSSHLRIGTENLGDPYAQVEVSGALENDTVAGELCNEISENVCVCVCLSFKGANS